MEISEGPVYTFGPYSMNVSERLLVHGNERIALEPRVFDTLRVLVENRGSLIPKDVLLQKVWADTIVEEGSLSRNISLLRRTLTEGGPYIETVPRVGYRFLNEAPRTAEAADLRANGAAEEVSASIRRRRRTLAALIGAVLIAAGLLATVRTVAAKRAPLRSLAVVPFTYDAAGSDEALRSELPYLSEGIAEGVTFHLSRIPGIKVISAGTMRAYREQQLSNEALAQSLGVQALVTGRLIPHGKGVLITVELSEPREKRSLWGEQYDVSAAGMQAVPGRVAADLSEKLRLRISGEVTQSIRRAPAQDPEAYRSYLKARYFLNKRTPEDTQRAVEYFRKAIARDPQYALAWAGLSDAFSTTGIYFSSEPRASLLDSKEAALKALEMDPSLAEAHTSLGFYRLWQEWDWRGAESEFARAVALNPNYATAHHFRAILLVTTGRFDEAIQEMERAEELDPLSLPITSTHAQVLNMARRYDQAIDQSRKTLEMDPQYASAVAQLFQSYLEKKMYSQAVATWNSLQEPEEAARLGSAFERGGIDGYHRALIESFKAYEQESGIDQSVGLAGVYARLGDRDEAFRYLERAYEKHHGWLIWLACHPGFENLRGDPRYDDLVRRIGIPVVAKK